MLPTDYARCLGVLEDHSAEQSCPRRHECARFIHREDASSRYSIRWAMCDALHDYFVGKGDELRK